jgi:hypothetical protein
MAKRILLAGGLVLVAGVLGYVMFVGLPRWGTSTSVRRTAAVATATPVIVPPPPGRKIKARLFYVTEDGTRLTSVERDVTYGDSAVEQAREIVAAQIAPVAAPFVSAIPAGTTLRAVFISEAG